MIKLVAFDLDGTIGDTIPMCLKALKKAVTPYVTVFQQVSEGHHEGDRAYRQDHFLLHEGRKAGHGDPGEMGTGQQPYGKKKRGHEHVPYRTDEDIGDHETDRAQV